MRLTKITAAYLLASSVMVMPPRSFQVKFLESEAHAGGMAMVQGYRVPVESVLTALQGKVPQRTDKESTVIMPNEVVKLVQEAKTSITEVFKVQKYSNPAQFAMQSRLERSADKSNADLQKIQESLNSLIKLGLISTSAGKPIVQNSADGKMNHIGEKGLLNAKDPTVAAVISLQTMLKIADERREEDNHLGLFDKATADATLKFLEAYFNTAAKTMPAEMLPRIMKLGSREIARAIASEIVHLTESRMADERVATTYANRDRIKIARTKKSIDAAFKAGKYETLLQLNARIQKEINEGIKRRKESKLVQAPQVVAANKEIEKRATKEMGFQYYNHIRELVDKGKLTLKTHEYDALKAAFFKALYPYQNGDYAQTRRLLEETVRPFVQMYEGRPAKAVSPRITVTEKDGFSDFLKQATDVLGKKEVFIAEAREKATKTVETINEIPQNRIKLDSGTDAAKLVGEKNSTAGNEIMLSENAKNLRLELIGYFEKQVKKAQTLEKDGKNEEAAEIYRKLGAINQQELTKAIEGILIARTVVDAKNDDLEAAVKQFEKLGNPRGEEREKYAKALEIFKAAALELEDGFAVALRNYNSGKYAEAITQVEAVLASAPDSKKLFDAMPKQVLATEVGLHVEPGLGRGEMVIKGFDVHSGRGASFTETPLSEYNRQNPNKKIEIDGYFFIEYATEAGNVFVVNPNPEERKAGKIYSGALRETIDRSSGENHYEIYEVKYELRDGRQSATITNNKIAQANSVMDLSEQDRDVSYTRDRLCTRIDRKAVEAAIARGEQFKFTVPVFGDLKSAPEIRTYATTRQKE